MTAEYAAIAAVLFVALRAVFFLILAPWAHARPSLTGVAVI